MKTFDIRNFMDEIENPHIPDESDLLPLNDDTDVTDLRRIEDWHDIAHVVRELDESSSFVDIRIEYYKCDDCHKVHRVAHLVRTPQNVTV